jgi:hypothetical protein
MDIQYLPLRSPQTLEARLKDLLPLSSPKTLGRFLDFLSHKVSSETLGGHSKGSNQPKVCKEPCFCPAFPSVHTSSSGYLTEEALFPKRNFRYKFVKKFNG